MINEFWNYAGAFVLVLILIYETKNYLLTLLAGFVVFCVFYFSYGFNDKNFHFSIISGLQALRDATLVYIFPYVAAAVLYAATKTSKKKKRVEAA